MHQTTMCSSIYRIFLLVAILVSVGTPVLSQDTDKATIVGTVIGRELPDFGWVMHTTNLDFLYVRVDKVLEGSVTSSYIIVGHPYNGSKRKLPDEILSGKYKWRFEISRFEEWNKEAATYVEEKDRGICKPVPVSGTTKELIDKLPKKEGETSNYFTCTINNWIEQAKGMEVEASSLASKGVLKAYFLSYGKKSPGKVP